MQPAPPSVMVEEVRAPANHRIHMKSVTHHFSRAIGFFSLSLQDLYHLSIRRRKREENPRVRSDSEGLLRTPLGSLGGAPVSRGSHAAEREPMVTRLNEEFSQESLFFCLRLSDH